MGGGRSFKMGPVSVPADAYRVPVVPAAEQSATAVEKSISYPCPLYPGTGTVLIPELCNCAYCARVGVSTFHWFLSARNLSLNFFGTRACPQGFNFKRAQYARFIEEPDL
eukprot:COSAG02_NODE_162_length_32474_cov_13.222511_6_plen_110_part_00